MEKLKVSLDKNRSSWDLNGRRMKMNLVINCNKDYVSHNGRDMAEDIIEAIERIMENYALIHEQPEKSKK